MEPVGKLATPYGVSVPVYFDRGRSKDEDECYFHDIDGCMTIAGVHGHKNRQRCKDDIKAIIAKGGITFDVFEKHGGRKALYLDLRKPARPVYPRLPHDMEEDLPIENWITLAMEHAHWDTRADVLINVIGSNLDASEGWGMPQEVQALALSQLLTASLEHLTETEIHCLEGAAMYAMTLHFKEWAKPAVEWLGPIKGTWFRDWVATRPDYARFAKLMRIVNPELPAWIAEVADE